MEDWVRNPNKKQLGLFSAFWFIGVALLILAATNFFTENPFLVRRNGLFLLIVIFPTVILILMLRNYFIHNRK